MKKKGFTLIELLVVIAIIAMLLAILMPALGKVKKMAQRLVCGTNLKGLGSSMYVYAYDYDDQFPSLSGAGTLGTATTNYHLSDRPTETVSVSASLYLLVREADVGFKSFVCPSSDQTAYDLADFDDGNNNTAVLEASQIWDFGNKPEERQSYAYQNPYSRYAASGSSLPENAIMGDRNPWLAGLEELASLDTDAPDNWEDLVAIIDTESQKWKQEIGNSDAHDREGQNLLFGDSHVSFERAPNVGSKKDNVYTIGTSQTGSAPSLSDSDISDGISDGFEPGGKHDTVLINDFTN